MKKLYELSARSSIPIYTKMQIIEKGNACVNAKKKKEYDYYRCDYCGDEIKIKKDRQKMTGGIATIPHTVTRRSDLTLALCNKCLNPVLKEFENEGV